MIRIGKTLHSSIPYIIPFAIFLILTGIAQWLDNIWIYPLKTILTGILLLWFRKSYSEIRAKFSLLAIIAGLVVFVIWIIPVSYPMLGNPGSVNPYEKIGTNLVFLWFIFRLFGASVVVPIMEELFWRSFLIRYLLGSDFKNVPIGKFSWPSFMITIILFGVEHHQWLAGIVAGVIYTLLLYRTKSIFACIVAHSVTNLTLGIYVLYTQQWIYW